MRHMSFVRSGPLIIFIFPCHLGFDIRMDQSTRRFDKHEPREFPISRSLHGLSRFHRNKAQWSQKHQNMQSMCVFNEPVVIRFAYSVLFASVIIDSSKNILAKLTNAIHLLVDSSFFILQSLKPMRP